MKKSKREMRTNTNNSYSQKRSRKKGAVSLFNEWFLSILLSYLNMREIIVLDSAICNSFDRKLWLVCIAKDFGSVATRIQPYLTRNGTVTWCSKRRVKFSCLKLDIKRRSCPITTEGVSLLAMCCVNMTEFQFLTVSDPTYVHLTRNLLSQLGATCSKLKKIHIDSPPTSGRAITALTAQNCDLEEIRIDDCECLNDACLSLIAENCHKLRIIWFKRMERFTDQGIAALVSANHNLEEVWMDECELLTDASLVALAANCHKLKVLSIVEADRITDEGLKAVMSSNHDLEKIFLRSCDFTDVSLIAIAENCHKVRWIGLDRMRGVTDQGISALVSANHDLEEIELSDCESITDASLLAISQHCHKLKKVHVSSKALFNAANSIRVCAMAS